MTGPLTIHPRPICTRWDCASESYLCWTDGCRSRWQDMAEIYEGRVPTGRRVCCECGQSHFAHTCRACHERIAAAEMAESAVPEAVR